MRNTILKTLRQTVSLALVYLLCFGSAYAGITVSGADGITISGADGITISGADGIVASGADGLLTFGVNGITISGADGITASGADGITASGADAAASVARTNGVVSSHPSGITISGADGITISGADGITISTADGTTRQVDSVLVRRPNGITISTADALRGTGANGVVPRQNNGITISGADGITISTADGITISTADGALARGADGQVFAVAPNGLSIPHADGITASGADGITISTADGITISTADGVAGAGASAARSSGLESVDPELAVKLDRMTDDSSVNAVVVYHHLPTDQDLADLQRIGVIGGTRFHVLPMVYVTATRDQIVQISHLAAVRSIYGNRTLEFTADPANGATGVDRARADADITRVASGLPVSGRGVTVAVLDTGVDATHADLAGRVVQNVKLVDTESAGAGFNYPANVENLPDTDQAYGHGTFVAGVIGGNGTKSSGQFTGVAPGANIVGLSAGDASLIFVLDGFDYLLDRGANLNVRVVNCSFSAATVYDTNDPVNVATKMLTDRNVNVVFSAGNDGPGLRTMNPYASAPWVISAGATEGGHVASYSSRGDFSNTSIHPTLVAPGTKVVSLRSSGVNQTGAEGPGFNSDANLPPALLPYYTTATGTSFSAPQVAGTIALMLQVNPQLTPAQVKDILERTATPLAPFYQYEAGAGVLNAHAAVLEAAFPQRHMGRFRAAFDGRFFRVVADPVQVFRGTVNPGSTGYDTTFSVPSNTLYASMQIGWGPLWATNDLGMALYDASGTKQADVNTLNLPGLNGHRERALVSRPSSGAWRMSVKNTLGAVGTAQDFTGVLETAHAEYAPMNDIAYLSAQQREDVYQSLRAFIMQPTGRNFRPTFWASRVDLAAALVGAGRVPQYLPATPNYRDVRDLTSMLFVESAQRSPRGALFPATAPGDAFLPNAPADRATAAIALVRAAGLQADADAHANDPLIGVGDAAKIPAAARGYVAIAIARGLLSTDSSGFRPQTAITRLELAHAMAVLESLLSQ